ncbi:M64 family metallopeptidase [Aureibacter tunicatorum]|uniref:IgA Peptidase M64 n=1 Tax=Aureibacter tunicatorum TaxID=866807 RepID=A0AAE3XR39_9BACT|nr:M64 family metallopeptidase [Aureibacter tunicatorum]MDR6241130.1 hypothetical protein [Aureibacter tunicatorum]
MGQKNEGCIANIIFLAEGFTYSEMDEFIDLCDIAKQTILEIEPFASASDNLNFYRVESSSKTSGIREQQFTSICNDTNGINTTSNTPWAVFSNRVGLKRYAGMEVEKRNLLEQQYGNYATGDYAYTIIIANTYEYLGSGETPGTTEHNTILKPKISNMIVSKYDSDLIFKYLIRHEFGHSFGNMDDEYESPETLCAMKTYEPWFLPQEPKPNVLTYNPNNWYEGARYSSTGYWREWENSIMRDDYYSTTFSPIQVNILEQRLKEAVGCP